MFKSFNRTKFMDEAKGLSKPKSPTRELLTAIILMFIITFAQNFVLTPASAIYLYTDNTVLSLLNTTAPDFEAIMQRLDALMLNQPDWLLIVTLFSTAVMTIISCLYCKFFEKRGLGTMGFRKRGAVLEYVTGFGFGTLLFFAVVAICSLIGIVKVETSSFSLTTILLYLLAYLVQGMAEETFIHGYYMVSLTKTTSVPYAMVNSSILFALLHMANSGVTFLSFLNLFLVGMLMSMYFVKRGNILGICALHSAWNFVQGNVFGLSVSGNTKMQSIFKTTILNDLQNLSGGKFGLEGSLITTLVIFLAIGVVILLKQNQKEIATTKGE